LFLGAEGGVQFWSCEPFEGKGAVKRIHGGSGLEDGNKLGYKGGGKPSLFIPRLCSNMFLSCRFP
jgi:hypothetical protein